MHNLHLLFPKIDHILTPNGSPGCGKMRIRNVSDDETRMQKRWTIDRKHFSRLIFSGLNNIAIIRVFLHSQLTAQCLLNHHCTQQQNNIKSLEYLDVSRCEANYPMLVLLVSQYIQPGQSHPCQITSLAHLSSSCLLISQVVIAGSLVWLHKYLSSPWVAYSVEEYNTFCLSVNSTQRVIRQRLWPSSLDMTSQDWCCLCAAS